MVGVERENFENLEPLDRRKRPFHFKPKRCHFDFWANWASPFDLQGLAFFLFGLIYGASLFGVMLFYFCGVAGFLGPFLSTQAPKKIGAGPVGGRPFCHRVNPALF